MTSRRQRYVASQARRALGGRAVRAGSNSPLRALQDLQTKIKDAMSASSDVVSAVRGSGFDKAAKTDVLHALNEVDRGLTAALTASREVQAELQNALG